MSDQGIPSSIPPGSRRVGTSIREDAVESSLGAFTESFPPPAIVLKPRTGQSSVPPPSAYRVLVGCDLSEFAEGVLREAVGFVHGHLPAELHMVTVVEKAKDHYILHSDEKRRHMAREVVEALMTDLIWKIGIPKGSPLEDAMQNVALHICVGDPAAEILRLGRELTADLIVVGSREHEGLHRRLWGSISKTVMANADCTVVLSRPVDFVHGHRTPSIEPPKMWTGEAHHLQTHHYYTTAAIRGTMPHVL